MVYNRNSMNKVHISFGLQLSNYGTTIPDSIKEVYQLKYKKIISFICSQPDFKLSLFIPGIILDWLKKNHPEFITVLSEKTEQGQIEMLSGGFYEPIMPLIIPTDRVAQIEKLTTSIRKYIGKKPRGAFLQESIWDPSLISTFNTSAMEYTFLDYSLIPQRRTQPLATFTPHIVEDLGKTISVIPIHNDFKPNTQNDIHTYIKKLQSIKESTKEKIVSVFFDIDEFIHLIEINWFTELHTELTNYKDLIDFTLPNIFLKNYPSRQKSYIPAGSRTKIDSWEVEPGIQQKNPLKIANSPTARDFISVYNEAFNLYSRLVYTSMLVNQCRNDKPRKMAAREFLYKAQHYSNYILTGIGGVRDKKLLSEAYKNLLEAEKLYRQAINFTNNTTSVDYTHDGNKEYLSFFETFNAFISSQGGMIFELDVLKCSKNYALGSKRKENTDSIQDFYAKKLFIDHIFTNSDFKSLVQNGTNTNSLFANEYYTENSYNRHRNTINLQARVIYGKEKVPLLLKKNYTINENAILVQYIIKNEGKKHVKAVFAIENNISFTKETKESVKAAILTPNYRKELNAETECVFKNDVSLVRLEDTETNVSFIFDVNEDCTYAMSPYFTTHKNKEEKNQEQYEAHSCYFSWNIDLEPEFETEKTIFLTIKHEKKKAVAKNLKK